MRRGQDVSYRQRPTRGSDRSENRALQGSGGGGPDKNGLSECERKCGGQKREWDTIVNECTDQVGVQLATGSVACVRRLREDPELAGRLPWKSRKWGTPGTSNSWLRIKTVSPN